VSNFITVDMGGRRGLSMRGCVATLRLNGLQEREYE
jgi:hypothetical protein